MMGQYLQFWFVSVLLAANGDSLRPSDDPLPIVDSVINHRGRMNRLAQDRVTSVRVQQRMRELSANYPQLDQTTFNRLLSGIDASRATLQNIEFFNPFKNDECYNSGTTWFSSTPFEDVFGNQCRSESTEDPTSLFKPQGPWFEGPDGFGYTYPWRHPHQSSLTHHASRLLGKELRPLERYDAIFNAYWGRTGVYPNFPLLEQPLKVVHPSDYKGMHYSLMERNDYLPLPHPIVGLGPYTLDDHELTKKTNGKAPTEEMLQFYEQKIKFCGDLAPYVTCEPGHLGSGTYGAVFRAVVDPNLMKQARGLQMREECGSFDVLHNKSEEEILEYLYLAKKLMQQLPKILSVDRGSAKTRNTTLDGFIMDEHQLEHWMMSQNIKGDNRERLMAETKARSIKHSVQWDKAKDLLRERLLGLASYPLVHHESKPGYHYAHRHLGFGRRFWNSEYYYSEEELPEYCGWTCSDECFNNFNGELIAPWGNGDDANELGILIGGLSGDSLIIAAKVMGWDLMIMETFPGIPVWMARGPLCDPSSSLPLQSDRPFEVIVKVEGDVNRTPRQPYQTRHQRYFNRLISDWKYRNLKKAVYERPYNLVRDGYILPPDQGVGDGGWLFGLSSVYDEPERQRTGVKHGFAPRMYDIVSTQVEHLYESGAPYYRPLLDYTKFIIMEEFTGTLAMDAMQDGCLQFPHISQALTSHSEIHTKETGKELRIAINEMAKATLPPTPKGKPDFYKQRAGFGFPRFAALPGEQPILERIPSVYGTLFRPLLATNTELMPEAITTAGNRLYTNLAMYYRDRALTLQMVLRRQFHMIDQEFRHCDLHWKNIMFSPDHVIPEPKNPGFVQLVKEYLNGEVVLLLNQPFVQSLMGKQLLKFNANATATNIREGSIHAPFIFPDGQFDEHTLAEAIYEWYKDQNPYTSMWLQNGTLGYYRVNDPLKHILFIDAAFVSRFDPNVPGELQRDQCKENHPVRMMDIMEMFMTWDASPMPKMIDVPSEGGYLKWKKDKKSDDIQRRENRSKSRLDRTGLSAIRLNERKTRGMTAMTCAHKSDNRLYVMPCGKGTPFSYKDWRYPEASLNLYSDKELIDYFIYRYNRTTDVKEKYATSFVESDGTYFLNLFKNAFSYSLSKSDQERHAQLLQENFVERLRPLTEWYGEYIHDFLNRDEDFILIGDYMDYTARPPGMPHIKDAMNALTTTYMWEAGVFGPYSWFVDDYEGSALDWLNTVYSKLFAINPPKNVPNDMFKNSDPDTKLLNNMIDWEDSNSMPLEWIRDYKSNVFDPTLKKMKVRAMEQLLAGPTQYTEDRIYVKLLSHVRDHLDRFQNDLIQSNASMSSVSSVGQGVICEMIGTRLGQKEGPWQIHKKRLDIMAQLGIRADRL